MYRLLNRLIDFLEFIIITVATVVMILGPPLILVGGIILLIKSCY